jgi:predicted dehydrogenase
MQNKKILVIGCGNIFTSFHYPVIKQTGGEIITIVEPNKRNYDLFIAKEGLENVNYHTTLLEVDFKNIDIALISNPSAFHAETLAYLMDKNIHIFCEKPILTDINSAGEELISKISTYSKIIQVGYYRRFSNASNYIRNLIKTEFFGKVNFVNMKGGWPAKNDLPISITDKKLSGGGITMDYGSHFIDHCFFWFDEVVLIEYADDSMGGIEINANINLKAKNGTPIQIDLSWTNFMGNFIQVHFEKAIVLMAFNNPNQLEIIELNFQTQNMNLTKDIHRRTVETTTYMFKELPAVSQWIEFLNRLDGKNPLISNAHQAIEVSNIINACYKNRKPLSLAWGY